MLDERLAALAACSLLFALLLYVRRRRMTPVRAANQRVARCDALWHHATAMPCAHLTTPLRKAVHEALSSYAQTLLESPLHLHASILRARAIRVLDLPKRNPMQVPRARTGEHCRALAQLLEEAHQDGAIDGKTLESARMAASLSAEMADIDALLGQASHANRLRMFGDAERYRSEALASCDRLPIHAAARVRGIVGNRFSPPGTTAA